MNVITLGVPSKGRLEEATRDVFAKAGLPIERAGGARAYQGAMKGQPHINVRFMPAGDIAAELIRGTLDMGVTGADLIHEAAENGPEAVHFAKALGFGGADVVIAVPKAWIDVEHMHDLSDVASDFRARHGRWLRVATKYLNLTRRAFAAHGIAEYRIVESLGATEAAPSSGAADLIVDITSTGSTLAANGLKILDDGVILKSEAHLIVSRNAAWGEGRKKNLDTLMAAFGAAKLIV